MTYNLTGKQYRYCMSVYSVFVINLCTVMSMTSFEDSRVLFAVVSLTLFQFIMFQTAHEGATCAVL